MRIYIISIKLMISILNKGFLKKKLNRIYQSVLSFFQVGGIIYARFCISLSLLFSDDFFLFKHSKKELYRPYKVHDLNELIILSGIYPNLLKAQSDISFKIHWSLVGNWKEDSSYLTGKTQKEVTEFGTSIKEISVWIKRTL